jgi:hypothetical protein
MLRAVESSVPPPAAREDACELATAAMSPAELAMLLAVESVVPPAAATDEAIEDACDASAWASEIRTLCEVFCESRMV